MEAGLARMSVGVIGSARSLIAVRTRTSTRCALRKRRLLDSLSWWFDLVLSEGKVYVPPPADPRYSSLCVMEPGAGYMIHMTSGGRLVYHGSAAPPTQAGAP